MFPREIPSSSLGTLSSDVTLYLLLQHVPSVNEGFSTRVCSQ